MYTVLQHKIQMGCRFLLLFSAWIASSHVSGFCGQQRALRSFNIASISRSVRPKSTSTILFAEENVSTSSPSSLSSKAVRRTKARDLLYELVVDKKCYSTVEGARAFADACAENVVIEDRYYPQSYVGKTAATEYILNRVEERKGKGEVRLDKISDGDRACGFAWTWTSGNEEGLRGTTFVELNDKDEIQDVQEIPEPIFKPGDLTVELLKKVTEGAEMKPPQAFTKRTPTVANEVAKYFYIDLQNAEKKEGQAEVLRLVDDKILYRDFNYENIMRGPAEVKKLMEDFAFPGIEFTPVRFDDGFDSTCFTWEVTLRDSPTILGLSFLELDPVSRKVVYARDVPESAFKPPILGKLARQLRPGLGVFFGVPLGSRPGGM